MGRGRTNSAISDKVIWEIILSLCLALMFLLMMAAVVRAEQDQQNPMVTIKVKGKYGNFTRPGSWVPVVIEVTNQGPDIKGKLRINQTMNFMGPQTSVDYVTPAVLPQGSTKQFEMSIPVSDFVNGLKVELLKGTEVIADGRGDFTFLGPEQLVVGLLDRSEEGFESLGSVKLANSLSPVLKAINSKEFPRKPEILKLFNVLIIDDINLKLEEDQAKAMADWVSMGGTLVVGGGSGWEKVYPNLPPDLPRANVTGEETRKLAGLPGLLNNPLLKPLSGPVKTLLFNSPTGLNRYVENDRSLVVEHTFGSGKVVCLGYDPAVEPMSSWTGSKDLWSDLLKLANFGANTSNMKTIGGNGAVFINGQMSAGIDNSQGIMMGVLNNIPSMELPSAKRILIFLGIYLLVVTIINYLVLKRLDRRELTWITLPVLSLLFVVIIYLTSFQTRPSEIIANQITVVNVNPDSRNANLTSAMGIFAPTFDNYTARLSGDYLVNPLPGYDEGVMQQPNSTKKPPALIEVEQTPGQTSLILKKMRSWNMRGFGVTGSTTMAGTISAEITRKDNKWIAVITNNTEYDFTDGVVISYPFWYVKTNDLKVGGKIEAEIPETTFTSNQGAPMLYQIYQPAFQGNGMRPSTQAADMLRQQLLSSMYETSQVKDQVIFVGWSKQPVKDFELIKEENAKKFNTTMFKVPLRIKVEGDNLSLPPGIIAGKIIDSSNVGMQGRPGSIFLQPNSQVTYQYDLPQGAFATLKIVLQTTNMQKPQTMNGSSFASTSYLYNWAKQSWEEASLNKDIGSYDQYLSPQRQMRLKIENKDGGMEISGSSIALGTGGDKK